MQNAVGFKNEVAASSGNIQSIQSNFVQEKHLSVLKEPAISKGEFYFQQGGKVRWEYREPFSQSIILNDNKFTILNNGVASKTDARTAKAYQSINGIMTDVLHGNTFNNADFSYAFFEGSTLNKVEMKPLKSQISEHLSVIELFFNQQHKVEQLIMRQPSGDYTVYQFQNQRYDQVIPTNTFEGKPLK